MASYQLEKSWNTSERSSSRSNRVVNANVYNFQAAVKKLLTKEEQKDITNILQCYNKNRNAYFLAQSVQELLNTPEKKCIISLLKLIIPKSDRASLDQFTCNETYVSHTSKSRNSCISNIYTNDSGISSHNNEMDCASKASDFSTYKQSKIPAHPPRRSSSLSDLSKKIEKSGKSLAGTFSSAVRRKFRAVLTRRGSSSSSELKPTVERRYGSETKLNKLPQENNCKPKPIERKARKTSQKSVNVSCDNFLRITIRRGKQREFGFTIGGGSEIGSGIFVSDVEAGSPADLAGLSKGDFIIKVNEMQFNTGVAHDTAVQVLSTLDNLTMIVKPYKSPKYGAAELPWTDVNGRPSSPPHTHSRGSQFSKPLSDIKRSSVHLLQAGERKVNLTVRPNQNLGLMIRGGSEYGLGIYITKVDLSSAADVAGLKVGDEIIEVNNVRLLGASHTEAVDVIKSSPILMMVVRFVGKVPQKQPRGFRTLDGRVSLYSTLNRKSIPNYTLDHRNGIKENLQRKIIRDNQMILPNKSPVHQTPVRVSSIMAALEEAVLASPCWMSLTEFERRSLRYYVKEYALENITIHNLVTSLTELLDSHEKLSLMSAVRECIDRPDLDRFDVLVLRKEVETLRNLQSSRTSGHDSSCSIDASSQHSAISDSQSYVFPSDANIQNSTPRSYDTEPTSSRNSDGKPFLSPVRPTDFPPPPLIKQAPPKPKRSSSLNSSRKENVDRTELADESKMIGKVDDDGDLRTNSPFTIAIENHRSSHSGRMKAENKPSHFPIPDLDFFEEPRKEVYRSNSTYGNLIKPVKNPVLSFNKAHCSLHRKISNDHAQNTPLNTMSVSSSTSTSSSSSVNDSSTNNPHPPLQQKFTLRPAMFGASVNEKVNHHHHPVKVDVHREPSIKSSKQVSPKPSNSTNINVKKVPLAENTDSSTEQVSAEDLENFYLNEADTQKVVVFRRANNLGLTIEGGSGTKQPLPRVLKVQPGSCVQLSNRIQVGHILHEVNGKSLLGLEHHDAVRAIALAFKEEKRDSIEFVISGPH